MLSEMVCMSHIPLINTILILQQHPRAEERGNHDAGALKNFLERHTLPPNCHIVLSTKEDMPTTHALAISDGVFYHQTSMAAQFALAEIPIIAQVAHKSNPDILLNSGYPFVSSASDLKNILSGDAKSIDVSIIEKGRVCCVIR